VTNKTLLYLPGLLLFIIQLDSCNLHFPRAMSLFAQRAMSGGHGSSGNNNAQNRGSLGSFASSVWSPSAGSMGRREESYHLLLELCAQEPTMQSCFKIVESTCLARGIDVEIGGKPPSVEFRNFVSRHYLPFAENALRYFFALGFVPWRLRKLSSGDVVPETIPLGLFTWAIESIPNRVSKKGRSNSNDNQPQQQQKQQGGAGIVGKFHGPGARGNHHGASSANSGKQLLVDKHQMAAQRSFEKQRAYFSDPKRVPYPLQGDVFRMGNRQDTTKKGQSERLKGFGEAARKGNPGDHQAGTAPNPSTFQGGHKLPPKPGGTNNKRSRDPSAAASAGDESQEAFAMTPAFWRQREALARQRVPDDDDETKMLRYTISFTENCNVLEDDVEIYEYMAPTNSITRFSLLYGTVPTPLSHILIDYRNIRTTLIRQAYADSYNTQAKMICSYNASKNMYNISEGNPILNGEGWTPQQRLGILTDSNLPSEIESNAYTRCVLYPCI